MTLTLRELMQSLGAMESRARDPRRALEHIANLMVASADRNFEVEGRPRWQEVRPATRRRKVKAGKSRILLMSGNLARSIVAQIDSTSVTIGTNVPYARIHQLGGVIRRSAGVIRAKLRTDARGNLLHQDQLQIGPSRMRNASKMLVFGKASHKRALEAVFLHDAYTITMPARPFLVFQPGEPEAYMRILADWILEGRP